MRSAVLLSIAMTFSCATKVLDKIPKKKTTYSERKKDYIWNNYGIAKFGRSTIYNVKGDALEAEDFTKNIRYVSPKTFEKSERFGLISKVMEGLGALGLIGSALTQDQQTKGDLASVFLIGFGGSYILKGV